MTASDVKYTQMFGDLLNQIEKSGSLPEKHDHQLDSIEEYEKDCFEDSANSHFDNYEPSHY